ncbi:sulfite exporter TauE/SafE family protein [Actinacidiphila bryophytorum]|uniref:sulfite exporter TauE/SafE family protein n=1 Tax=Actinacidiphila bryophytorum TaxID=1436133 RepID=UPI002176AC03|nr:sulfite exporter TauE/SafE family protein [Actinacidiphila bryophytorum]UWE10790.1 sulfite exporter TauE/SafE family protein [Actinacidiphila bryophytorum]
MNGWADAFALAAIVLAGSTVQRMSGMGFALVAVPALVLLIGPAHGVALSNCASGVISAAGLVDTWRRVRLAAMAPLVVAAACTVPAGTWALHHVPEPDLLTGMGLLVTVSVAVIASGVRVPALRGRGGAVTAGAASGFMNASAGVGGPAVSLYAVNAEWSVAEFVPNAQFYGVVVNALSLGAKGVPHLSTPVWALAAAGMAVGTLAGRALSDRVPERWARPAILLLALAGGLTTLGKGIGEW